MVNQKTKGARHDEPQGSIMSDNPGFGAESSAVQKHLEIMQGVITRMAENSRSCKLWSVTLVAATLILVERTGEPRHALIALVPTALFLVLDTYYLALERAFRNSYNTFVGKLHRGELVPLDIFSGQASWHGVEVSLAMFGVRVDIALLPSANRDGSACLVADNPREYNS